jgi:hypothetical protein
MTALVKLNPALALQVLNKIVGGLIQRRTLADVSQEGLPDRVGYTLICCC